ncbi:MAG: hypothetical protein ACRC6D_12300, partial [Aeromonas sp.]
LWSSEMTVSGIAGGQWLASAAMFGRYEDDKHLYGYGSGQDQGQGQPGHGRAVFYHKSQGGGTDSL